MCRFSLPSNRGQSAYWVLSDRCHGCHDLISRAAENNALIRTSVMLQFVGDSSAEWLV